MEFQNVALVVAILLLILIGVMLPDRSRARQTGDPSPPHQREPAQARPARASRQQPKRSSAPAQPEPEEVKKWPNIDPSYIPNHPLNPNNRR